jgi:alpha-galactosidase
MTKIAFIGAGSTVFAKNLMGDILSYPELADCTISLMDIDQKRLQTSEGVAHKINEVLGTHATIETTTDRRAALDGADYASCMIQVGGYKPATVIDFEIPKKYGLRQTIGDTLGIRGIMRALRTIPVLLSYLLIKSGQWWTS